MFGFIVGLGFALVAVVVSAILLWISTKICRLKNGSFKNALVVSAIVVLINYVLGYAFGFIPFFKLLGSVLNFVLTIILGIVLVKSRYKLDGGKAFLVWLVWFIFAFIASAIIAAIFAALFVGAALTAGAGSLLMSYL